jgi:hypothetical protein
MRYGGISTIAACGSEHLSAAAVLYEPPMPLRFVSTERPLRWNLPAYLCGRPLTAYSRRSVLGKLGAPAQYRELLNPGPAD